MERLIQLLHKKDVNLLLPNEWEELYTLLSEQVKIAEDTLGIKPNIRIKKDKFKNMTALDWKEANEVRKRSLFDD